MFERALEVLGAPAGDTVMIGDSPAKDIAPAKILGIRTVLVALQADPVDYSGADLVVRSMGELEAQLLC